MLPNRITALIVTTLLVIGCASSPTGRPQLAFKSEREMRQMGEQAFTQIKAQTPLSRDGQAIRIVLCVAEAITSRLPAEQRGAGWEVLVFDGNAVNAFALPGNKIGVYEGIFRAARNQDQLAAVIGHEVAHVTARHANERVSTTYAAQFGVNVWRGPVSIPARPYPCGRTWLGSARRSRPNSCPPTRRTRPV
jgi:predicted Zn-dependent protease